MTKPRAVSVHTHQSPEETGDAIRRLLDAAGAAGVEVHVPEEEVRKHGLSDREGAVFGTDHDHETDLALVLGGDGTILTTLRVFTGRRVPVFAFNFGAIGFLSTVDHDSLDEGLERAFSGRYDVVSMPGLAIDTPDGVKVGINDISFHRRPDGRVAELAYTVAGEQLGQVRCDGLVVSTPAGSTGYNLANGGPVLAWGVEGFVVSFIAPHTLTARALVVAPADWLTVSNLSEREAVDVTTDGRTVANLGPGDDLDVHLEPDQVRLAQLPGSTFYRRLREKFGRLAY